MVSLRDWHTPQLNSPNHTFRVSIESNAEEKKTAKKKTIRIIM